MTSGVQGSTEPRVATPLPSVTDRVKEVDHHIIGRFFGAGLDPWQRIMVEYRSAQGADGHWLLPTVGVVVGRQNGKSHAVVGRILDDLSRGRAVVACAQNLEVAVPVVAEGR